MIRESAKGLSLLEKIIEKDPAYVEAIIMYGQLKHKLKHDDAASAFEKVIALDPRQENIYLLLGNMYMQKDKLDKALTVYKKLVKNFPGSYVGYFYLGKIYSTRDMLDEAENAFLKTIELNPELEEPRFELLNLYDKLGKKEKIDQLYQDILRKNPKNIRAKLLLGHRYYQKGMKQEAEKLFADLGKRSLTEDEIIKMVVQLYIEPKKYDAAIVTVKEMLKGAPDSSDLHYVAGIAFNGKTERNMALIHFKRVMPDSRFYEEAAVHIAFLYQDQKKISQRCGYHYPNGQRVF